jgi:photosystem II stability/assembly factor-like uncharacterized protein
MVRSISFTSNSTGYCLDMSGELLKTTDGGVTWNVVDMAMIPWDIYGISFVSPQVGFACGDDSTVYKTVDGGALNSLSRPCGAVGGSQHE